MRHEERSSFGTSQEAQRATTPRVGWRGRTSPTRRSCWRSGWSFSAGTAHRPMFGVCRSSCKGGPTPHWCAENIDLPAVQCRTEAAPRRKTLKRGKQKVLESGWGKPFCLNAQGFRCSLLFGVRERGNWTKGFIGRREWVMEVPHGWLHVAGAAAASCKVAEGGEGAEGFGQVQQREPQPVPPSGPATSEPAVRKEARERVVKLQLSKCWRRRLDLRWTV